MTATMVVEDLTGKITVSAAYCPSNYPANKQILVNILENRFLAGGDYNTKHTSWGSRLTAPGRGKTLYELMRELRLDHLSSYTPTYIG